MAQSEPQPALVKRLSTAALTYPKTALLLLAALVLVGLSGMLRLHEEEDILAFLPADDPDVGTFREVARQFGALRVALIGVEPPAGQALFSADVLRRLDRLSTALRNVQGVDRVVSLSTMTDLDGGAAGVEIRPLIPQPVPADEATLHRLEARALALPQVRGSIVSADGKAALVLVFLAEGASTRRVASKARDLARSEMGGARLYYGGAPFAGQAIYDGTQVDVRRLTPIALLIFFLVVLVSFRDWLAVVLTIGTVGVAGILVTGGMGLFGEPFTVVTAMLPVILFAAGSQYAIHILGRYYLLRVNKGPLESAEGALQIAGPPVSIAAAATACGFLSFLVMNIQPMRSFGVACASGIFICWLLAMTVLPAVVVAWPRPYEKPERLARLEQQMEDLWMWVQRNRVRILIISALLLAVSLRFAADVRVRMEPRAFFRAGSEPALAQTFLDTRFGGSQFVQVAVSGDLLHPNALRELRRLGAYARSLPGVSQVQSIIDPLMLVGEAMGTGKGLPPERKQITNLLFFIDGEPSVRTLLTADRKGALLHVRISGDAQPVLKGLDEYLSRRWPYQQGSHTLDELSEELTWLLPPERRKERRAELRTALARAAGEAQKDLLKAATTEDAARARREAMADLGLVAGAPLDEGGRVELEERLRDKLSQGLARAAVEDVVRALGPGLAGRPLGADDRTEIEAVVSAVRAPVPQVETPPLTEAESAGFTGATALQGRLSGEPVLDRGFSNAVERNQWHSLRVAMVAVFLLLLLTLRSVYGAALCLLPAGLSLAVIFGALGLMHRPMDIGTSLVGSIVTGSGADFAMHYMWYLRRNHPRDVVRNIGPVILITAVLLAGGLGVNALGNSPPIQLFGCLAAAGLLLSAAFTFLLVPAFLRKVRSAERHDFG